MRPKPQKNSSLQDQHVCMRMCITKGIHGRNTLACTIHSLLFKQRTSEDKEQCVWFPCWFYLHNRNVLTHQRSTLAGRPQITLGKPAGCALLAGSGTVCMFVINGRGFLRFLLGFCVIIFAYVRDSEILTMKRNLRQVFACQKYLFRTTLKVFISSQLLDLFSQP